MRWPLLFGLVMLTKPDGGHVWIVENQIVAVTLLPHVGKAPTMVTTLNGTFYVREPPEAVVAKIGGHACAP